MQELLGPRYAVVNLSFRGAYPTEGAALVAESLQRRGIPLIYVANTSPDACGLPVGSIYEYLYWEAAAGGRLVAHAPRDAAIAYLQTPAAREKSGEFHRAAWLNHWLHFKDLWTDVGYRHFFTVWCAVGRRSPWAPRIKAPDSEPRVPPLAQRFMNNNGREMEVARATTRDLITRDATGNWQKNLPVWERLDMVIEAAVVPGLRPHTLMILSLDCPYYRDQLTPEELIRDETAYRIGAAVWPQHGIRSLLAGVGYTAEDYVDRRHLSASGGVKLAKQVAGEIRQMQPSPGS